MSSVTRKVEILRKILLRKLLKYHSRKTVVFLFLFHFSDVDSLGIIGPCENNAGRYPKDRISLVEFNEKYNFFREEGGNFC